MRRRYLQGPREVLCWRRRTILLELDQTTAQSRCSLAHAIGHLDLSHATGETTSRFRDREERAADNLAARRLLPLPRLTEALLWADSTAEAATDLWVDLAMLRCRLDHLHPSERAAIKRAFAARDNTEEGQ